MNARRAAFDALTAITRDGAYISLALKEHIPSELSDENKRFASLLVRTTLESLLRIDYALGSFITSGRVHGSVKNVLRLGACQILLMDTEGYAAVSESVDLVKRIKPQMSGFVNAVLRALENGKDDITYPSGENAQALSIAASYPEWICEKYIADFGYAFAKDLLSYKNPKGTNVRLNTLRTDKEHFTAELERAGLRYSQGNIRDSYLIQGLTDVENTVLYKSGSIAIQSESAMRAVLDTGIQRGMKLLDCCSAPGGKSACAAALAGNTLDITAWDIHGHRVEMTKKNFERLGVENARAVLHDAGVYEPELNESFDVVLIDAPCSAMGLMAKSPDVRYSRKPEDIAALSKAQYDILSACAKYVKPKGTLAYYTCSINKEENEQVTDRFVSGSADFSYHRPPETLYPHICGSDGFYIAVMKRT